MDFFLKINSTKYNILLQVYFIKYYRMYLKENVYINIIKRISDNKHEAELYYYWLSKPQWQWQIRVSLLRKFLLFLNFYSLNFEPRERFMIIKDIVLFLFLHQYSSSSSIRSREQLKVKVTRLNALGGACAY